MPPPAASPAGTSPITTLTVFSFAPGSRAWAFAQMGMARPLLRDVPGLRFHRMMGAGRGLGFTLRPDWGRYALLGVWSAEADARAFLDRSAFMDRYRSRAARVATATLRTRAAHGRWGGANPFLPVDARPAHAAAPGPHRPAWSPPVAVRSALGGASSPQRGVDPDVPLETGRGTGEIAVLTRALIHPLRAGSFWGEVPSVSRRLAGAEGLIASIGIGEAPLLLQATFSVWRSEPDMRRFAYNTPEHRRVIRRVRRERWYGEELFARFDVVERTPQFP